MAKRIRQRPSWEGLQALIRLLIGAIQPIAQLIDAITRIR
jgi:hypothetical protein